MSAFAALRLRRDSLRSACRAEARLSQRVGIVGNDVRLRRAAATARQPSLGLPSRSSTKPTRWDRGKRCPPSPRCGYGATAFARLAEPKLGEAERRLVDQTGVE